MTGVEILAWLVLAFADGPDCLLQASLHRLPDGRRWCGRTVVPSIHSKRGIMSYFGPAPDGSPSRFLMERGRYPTGGGEQWPS